jgi:GAF domain-containing protein
MAALSTVRESQFQARDLQVMQTAAGQLGVAIENARLFTQEQRRARHLAFLNTISKMAISSEDAEQMMAGIVHEIQKNFRYDHIGIGIMDYATKESRSKPRRERHRKRWAAGSSWAVEFWERSRAPG